MRRLLHPALSFIFFVILAASAVGQSRHNQLVGRWRSTDVSPTGISAIFEFHDDNRMDSYSAAISEERYRLVGTDTIVLQTKNGQETREVEWDSEDRARIEDEAAGKSIELVRLGKIPDSKNPLVGEWSTTREWNGGKYPARVFFFREGKVLWLATLRTEHGRYLIQSNTIRLEVPGRPVVKGGFAATENRLILPNPNGSVSNFDRF